MTLEICNKPSDPTELAWTCNLPKGHGGECSAMTLEELDELATPEQAAPPNAQVAPPVIPDRWRLQHAALTMRATPENRFEIGAQIIEELGAAEAELSLSQTALEEQFEKRKNAEAHEILAQSESDRARTALSTAEAKIKELEAYIGLSADELKALHAAKLERDALQQKLSELSVPAEGSAVNARLVSAWIDAKRRPPAYGVPVLVVYHGVVQKIAYYRDIGEWHPADDDGDPMPEGEVSHWMPWPKPPGKPEHKDDSSAPQPLSRPDLESLLSTAQSSNRVLVDALENAYHSKLHEFSADSGSDYCLCGYYRSHPIHLISAHKEPQAQGSTEGK